MMTAVPEHRRTRGVPARPAGPRAPHGARGPQRGRLSQSLPVGDDRRVHPARGGGSLDRRTRAQSSNPRRARDASYARIRSPPWAMVPRPGAGTAPIRTACGWRRGRTS
jgi:hypothetical protein